ncbi:MAG: site-specific DNA-methyltransferase, partial [Clostridia bacterium]|nr:site-specific DNA-methyltransferase [Clostridia bacterium]
MDKMRMETPDLTAGNVEKIAALFPNCITETKDGNGKLKKAVNFDLLRQMLSGDVVEGHEAYEFTWVGKKAAIVEANKPIRKTLRPCPAESVDWDTTENLYIEGDNLEVLKLLQESYLGKVKMIYIDPPYNTGNDFIYRDDFAMSSDEYSEESGAVDDEGNRLFRNTDSNGRFHSNWCSMIYSRLMLARNILSDDGAIFISIDDNEQENLKKICDEVFGSCNFIATMIWQQGKKSSGNLIGINHEYMLVYAKNRKKIDTPETAFKQKKTGLDKIYAKYEQLKSKHGTNYIAISEGIKEFFNSLTENDPAYPHRLYCLVDERGLYQSDNSAAPDKPETRSHRPLIHPVTKKPTAVPAMGWRFTDKTLDELLKKGYIHFGEDETKVPRVKRYLSEYEYEIPATVFYKPGAAASSELQKIFGKKIFDNPKDRGEIKRIIGFLTNNDDIILDFFSGSATTAHAVMQLNAEDGGHRKFIMVQLPETTDKDSEAYKAGYKNICEIGKERIRRAGAKLLNDIAYKNRNSVSQSVSQS